MSRILQKDNFWKRERYFQVLDFLLAIGICSLVIIFRAELKELSKYTYLGAFLLSIITNSTIVIPVPGWVVIASLGTILNPFLLGLISGVGGTIGELNGYLLGYGGRIVIKENVTYQRMASWIQRWGSLVIFVFALIPNPLFDIAGVASGALKFPIRRFIIFGMLGRIPKHVGFALLGLWGWGFFGP